ncbi:hypothetical protein [Deinococcus peraridilitoris]|uniref:Uncharacterized protein n=1 Tax=Deinococcus peraridilitoris (strain DSM 19664 / LMG 22246 / CIP 109416 / KR-200) TaxID=937777 RepID=L0A3K9_DEIPD|nr:hypothetical protein [Deinococcus peraridilitoris]AFZ68431.1 hypothetical protein Deipe_2979 [Deinococcus peraridilitoris DSM 19664]
MFEPAAQALQVVAVMAVLLLSLALTRLWIRMSLVQGPREASRQRDRLLNIQPLNIQTMALKQDHAPDMTNNSISPRARLTGKDDTGLR